MMENLITKSKLQLIYSVISLPIWGKIVTLQKRQCQMMPFIKRGDHFTGFGRHWHISQIER